MAAGQCPITIKQGESLNKVITLKNKATGQPIDVTGWKARCQARDPMNTTAPPLFDLSVDNAGLVNGGVAGTFTMVDAYANTSAWAPKTYEWDFFALDTGGNNKAYLEGPFTVEYAQTQPQW